MTFAKVQSFPAMTTTHLAHNARLCAAYMGSGTLSRMIEALGGVPGLGSTDQKKYRTNGGVVSTPLPIKLRPGRDTWIKPEGGGV